MTHSWVSIMEFINFARNSFEFLNEYAYVAQYKFHYVIWFQLNLHFLREKKTVESSTGSGGL